jgi:hypothetical protein
VKICEICGYYPWITFDPIGRAMLELPRDIRTQYRIATTKDVRSRSFGALAQLPQSGKKIRNFSDTDRA